MAFSPDGKYVLSGGEDSAAKLWRISRIKLDQETLLSGDHIPPLTFSQKLEYDTIELDEVLVEEDDLLFADGADYFRRKCLDEKQIYLKNEYFSKATAMYDHLLNKRSSKFDNNRLANICFDFGMLQLLNGNVKGAIATANKGLELEEKPPVKNYSVLATGILLDGQFKEAEKIYLEWKGQNGEYPKLFLETLSTLKRAGVHNSDMEKIETLLKSN